MGDSDHIAEVTQPESQVALRQPAGAFVGDV